MKRNALNRLMNQRREAGDVGNDVELRAEDFEELARDSLVRYGTPAHIDEALAKGVMTLCTCNGVTTIRRVGSKDLLREEVLALNRPHKPADAGSIPAPATNSEPEPPEAA